MEGGTAVQVPGFCFTRVTDFACFIWVKPTDLAAHSVEQNLNYYGFDPDDIQEATQYSYYAPGYENLTGGFVSNDTNMTSNSFDEEYLWDYYGEYFGVNFPEKDAAKGIYIWVSPLLLLIGTLGNIFSLIIMYRLSNKIMSTCLYLAILAIVDLIVLYTRCGNDWLSHMAQIDLSNRLMVYSESICKVYPFGFNFIFHLSKWLIVAMAVEAFISIKYPHKIRRMCTLERARAVVLLLTVLLICINMHYFWTFELVPLTELSLPPGLYCTFAKHGHQHSEEFQDIIWPIMDLLTAEVLPYATVIVCAIIMVIQISRGRHMGDVRHQQWQAKFTLDSQAIEQLKLTYLVICVFFVLLTLPKFGYVIFKYLVEKHGLLEYNFQNEAKQLLAHAICASLEYCQLSCKCVVYLIVSKRFRREFVYLFRCCLRKGSVVHSPPGNGMVTSPLMQNGGTDSITPRLELHDDPVITTV